MKKILFIANNNIGTGLSGGDRIFLELYRYWQKNINVSILGSAETKNLLLRYKLPNNNFYLSDSADNDPIIIHQIKRLIKGIIWIIKNNSIINNLDYVYSTSDFYHDSLAALIIKIFHPKIIWIAGYYLDSPNPFSPSSPYNQTHRFFQGLIYFIGQIPVKLFINHFADIVYITSDPDKKLFPRKKTIVIRGGVDTSISQKYFQNSKNTTKIYEAVFLGRLHPQKGVIELIDVWNNVVSVKPNAKLAIIGDGNLEPLIKQKINKLGLNKNITLFGFQDGDKKYQIFQQSKTVVHPAIYDSGGMAAAEAMSFGLPGVSFDLEALKTYYPKGMIKTQCFNLELFANNILQLLDNKKLYLQYSKEAKELIEQHWSWQTQAEKIFDLTFKN